MKSEKLLKKKAEKKKKEKKKGGDIPCRSPHGRWNVGWCVVQRRKMRGELAGLRMSA